MEIKGEKDIDYINAKKERINILQDIVKNCEESKEILPEPYVDMIRDVIDPTRIKGRYKGVVLGGEDGEKGIRIIIPGHGYEWDSLEHLNYFIDWIIIQTKQYQHIFDISDISKIKEMIYKLDKSGIIGIAARIRDIAVDIPHRTLNDIVHSDRKEEDTPPHIRSTKNRFRGEWSQELYYEAQDHIVEILEKKRHLVPLIDENHTAVYSSYNTQIKDRLHKTLINMYLTKSTRLDKLETELRKYGGGEHLAGLTESKTYELCINNRKSKYYDHLVNALWYEWNLPKRIKTLVTKLNDKLYKEIESYFKHIVDYSSRTNDKYAPRKHINETSTNLK